jgi:uncharacterized membrane protein YcaP (DUF421 family)
MAHTIRGLAIVAGSTAVIYLFLIVLLRLFGRRELSQLTLIDLIVILTLGSAVETSMIHGDLSLPAGITSASTLMIVNRGLTSLFARSKRLRHWIGGGPVLLVHDCAPVYSHLRRVGMSDADLMEALRGRGYDDLSKIRFAVLETDGEVTVVPRDHGDDT